MSGSTGDFVLLDGKIYDYDWSIQMSRMLLNFYGLWQPSSDTKWHYLLSNVKFVIIVVYTTVVAVIPLIFGMIMNWGDFILFLEMSVALFAHLLGVVKLVFIYFKKEGLREIFEMIAEDWLDNLKNDEKRNLIQASKMSKKLYIIGCVLPFATTLVYNGPAVFQLGFIMRSLVNTTDQPGRPTSLVSYIPFDMQSMIVYRLVLYNQFIGGSLSVVGFALTDLLCANFLFHASSMMKNLSLKIRYVFDDDSRNLRDKIAAIVENHRRVIAFVDKIGSVFNMLLLGIFFSFALNFCTHGFNVINWTSIEESSTLKSLFWPVYSVLHFSDLTFTVYLINWAGQHLINQSEEVFDEIYNCNWFNLQAKESMMWITLLMRFKYSLGINAGYFIPIDYSTFTKLMKTCASYISVLVAMKE